MAVEIKETMNLVERSSELLVEDSEISHPNMRDPNTVKFNWQPGDLLWARIGRYPFWPGVVVVDPLNEKYFQLKRTGRSSQQHFHVQFFGDNGSRSWVSATQTLKYTGKSDLFKFAESTKKDKRAAFLQTGKNQKWDCAVQEAEEALSKSRNERIQFFEEIYPISTDRDDSVNREKSVETVEKSNKSSSQKRPRAEDKTQQQSKGSPERETKSSSQEQDIPSKSRKGDLQTKGTAEENFNVVSKSPPHKKMKRPKPKKKPGRFEVFVDSYARWFAIGHPELQADQAKCHRYMQAMWSSMTEEEKSRYHGSYEEISGASEQ